MFTVFKIRFLHPIPARTVPVVARRAVRWQYSVYGVGAFSICRGRKRRKLFPDPARPFSLW